MNCCAPLLASFFSDARKPGGYQIDVIGNDDTKDRKNVQGWGGALYITINVMIYKLL
jgi:hypothetical protein